MPSTPTSSLPLARYLPRGSVSRLSLYHCRSVVGVGARLTTRSLDPPFRFLTIRLQRRARRREFCLPPFAGDEQVLPPHTISHE